jgi:hypothetical protein
MRWPQGNPSAGAAQAPDLRSRRGRRFRLRWRRPAITTEEAIEVYQDFAARHGGSTEAALGELIALVLERDARAS